MFSKGENPNPGQGMRNWEFRELLDQLERNEIPPLGGVNNIKVTVENGQITGCSGSWAPSPGPSSSYTEDFNLKRHPDQLWDLRITMGNCREWGGGDIYKVTKMQCVNFFYEQLNR